MWIKSTDQENANLMILLSYIISGHPDWRVGKIKIYELIKGDDLDEAKTRLMDLMKRGRIPVTEKNIEILSVDPEVSSREIIREKSENAGLTMIGFHSDNLKHKGVELFAGYEGIGDVLFVNASARKEI